VAPDRALAIAPGAPDPFLRKADQALMAIRQRRILEAERAAQSARESLAKGPQTASDVTSGANPAGSWQPTPEELITADEAAAWLRQALVASPMSVPALRMLGEVADLKGDREAANKFMSVAASRWLHEAPAIYHVMLASLEAKDYAATVEHADALLRSHPELWRAVNPVLVYVAEAGQSAHLVIRRLVLRPDWRPNFLRSLLESSTDVRTPLDIFLGLNAAGSPPDHADLSIYLQSLLNHGHYEVAYYAWLQLLPPERLSTVKLLFNGDFELPLSNLPMDWTLKDGIGARVEVAPYASDSPDRGIRVELGPDRVMFGKAFQWLVLPPGTYALTGKYRGNVTGRRGLRWKVHCMNTQETVVGETPMFIAMQREWRNFETSFEIPATNCNAQQLRLVFDARYSAEQFATGVGWYDKLEITRK
jgi:hypothetical protein